MYALQPVAEIGSQYAERCLSYFASLPARPAAPEASSSSTSSGSEDVDDLLLQVMPDREKIGRLARLAGTLRYAVEGRDRGLIEETVKDMQRISRHLGDKYRPAELIAAARSTDARGAQLAELYLERCYRLVDEDYAAMADLDSKIEQLKPAS